MAEQMLETEAQDAGITPPSEAPPASPSPQPDDSRVKAAEERVRREAQAAKDREIARLHQDYQNRERALREAAKTRLKQVGDDQADAWDGQIELVQDAAYGRNVRLAEEARQQAWAQAAEIAEVLGVSPSDGRFLQAWTDGFNDWGEFRARVKNIAAADARVEREREKQAALEAQQQAATDRVNSGNLATLGVSPAGGAANRQQTIEQLYSRLEGLLRDAAPRAKREEVEAELRRLGEAI